MKSQPTIIIGSANNMDDYRIAKYGIVAKERLENAKANVIKCLNDDASSELVDIHIAEMKFEMKRQKVLAWLTKIRTENPTMFKHACDIGVIKFECPRP